jgi:hypothetical protein
LDTVAECDSGSSQVGTATLLCFLIFLNFWNNRTATRLCIGRVVHREMRCLRGLQANQALQSLQLKGIQLQMERLASSAMARFLYKGPGRSSAMDAQQSSILPQPANSSPVSRAAVSRGQGFCNFMRRGYLSGRSSLRIVSVSGAQGEGCNGSDRESSDSSFFGIYFVS